MAEPLFEAKITYNEQLELYNIFRIDGEKYKAKLVDKNGEVISGAPKELTLFKENGKWQTDDTINDTFGSTLGMEIDVFNTGYGDLLGRIGVR